MPTPRQGSAKCLNVGRAGSPGKAPYLCESGAFYPRIAGDFAPASSRRSRTTWTKASLPPPLRLAPIKGRLACRWGVQAMDVAALGRTQRSAAPSPGMDQKSMAGIEAALSSLGRSATIASVVMSSEATEAASCSAVRTTFAGSMTPDFTRSSYAPVAALKPQL